MFVNWQARCNKTNVLAVGTEMSSINVPPSSEKEEEFLSELAAFTIMLEQMQRLESVKPQTRRARDWM